MSKIFKNQGLIGVQLGRFAKRKSTGGYDTPVDVGTMVKASLAVTTADLEVFGDNALQISDSSFVSGTLTTETNYNDLQTEATLYGHTYTAEGGLIRNANDVAPAGGYGYIQNLLKKVGDVQNQVVRAVFLPDVTAQLANWTDEAETRQKNTVFKGRSATFKVATDDSGNWNFQKEFAVSDSMTVEQALAAAEAWLDEKFGVAAAAATEQTTTT